MSSKPHVVADANIPLLDELAQEGFDVSTVAGRSITREQLLRADALLVRSVTNVDEQLLAGTPVKFVGTATAGVNHLDMQYLARQGIIMSSAPGANAMSVSEYVLMFACLWMVRESRDPADVTVGIVGWGNIGMTVGRLVAELGCRVLFFDPYVEFEQLRGRGVENFTRVEMHELLKQADIVSLHVPLVSDGENATRGLLGAAELELLQQGSMLIQTCRGEVINERSLLSAIQEKSLAVVCDVWNDEPNVNKALAEAVWYGTPHIAGYSHNGKTAGARMVFRALKQSFGLASGNHHTIQHTVPTLHHLLHEQKLDLQALVKHIDHQRQLLSDALDFKRSLELSDNERAKAFDTARKSYPIRWESLRL